MRSLILALLALFFVTGCGISPTAQLSEGDAIEILQGVPLEEGDQNVFGEYSDTSFDELERVISRYSGEPQTRGLWGKKKGSRLGTLRNLFSVLQSGEADDAESAAYALVDLEGGNVQKTAVNLDTILNILKKVSPFISTLFPKLGPILDALLNIIPIILSIFGG